MAEGSAGVSFDAAVADGACGAAVG
jgi:hypothetical protein